MIKNGERGVRSERRVVSLRKLQANRQNALRSTGPRTARGREYSRRNALKHGLFAMDVFQWDGAKRESQHQYQGWSSGPTPPRWVSGRAEPRPCNRSAGAVAATSQRGSRTSSSQRSVGAVKKGAQERNRVCKTKPISYLLSMS